MYQTKRLNNNFLMNDTVVTLNMSKSFTTVRKSHFLNLDFFSSGICLLLIEPEKMTQQQGSSIVSFVLNLCSGFLYDFFSLFRQYVMFFSGRNLQRRN